MDNKSIRIVTNTPDETRLIGEAIGTGLKSGNCVAFCGDLGSGKTTMIRGIVAGIDGADENSVASPSFVIVREYPAAACPIYHMDFYRLEGAETIGLLDWREYMHSEAITLIEWSEKAKAFLPAQFLEIELTWCDGSVRVITLTSHGGDYRRFIDSIGTT